MQEQKETIGITQNKSKYIITRKIVEEVDKDQLLKIYDEISKALAEARKQLEDLPKQLDERQRVLDQQVKTLEDRHKAFGQHADKLKEEIRENTDEPEIEVVDTEDIQKKPAV